MPTSDIVGGIVEALEALMNKKLVFVKSAADVQGSYHTSTEVNINNAGNEKPSKIKHKGPMRGCVSSSVDHDIISMNAFDTGGFGDDQNMNRGKKLLVFFPP